MEFNSDFKIEQQRVRAILSIVPNMVAQLEAQTQAALDRVDTLYETFSMDTPEFHSEIPVAEQLYYMSLTELQNTQKLLHSPYFGKLIFQFDFSNATEEVYLGKKGINKSDAFAWEILDWRTPFADVYYSGTLGKTGYEAPKGYIGLDLKQKTTIKVKDGELQNVYDSEIVANDDLLAEYLSKGKSTVLNEIVATIQADQNAIIRKPVYTNLVVQGVAGSGKTTVALHRISFLLYNYPEILNYKNVFLIASNKLFLGYISGMLPDLDVPTILQGVMQEVLLQAIHKYDKRFGLAPQPDEAFNPVYDNDGFLPRFGDALANIEAQVFADEDVGIGHLKFMTKKEIRRYNRQAIDSLHEKARRLDTFLLQRFKDYKGAIIEYITDHIHEPQIAAFASEYFELEPNRLFTYEITQNYGKFTKKYHKYFSKRVEKLRVDQIFADFSGNASKKLDINDLACLLLFFIRIKGLKEPLDIRHVVIDEAQDFNLVVYCCLKAMYPKANCTIVGDVMQNIGASGLLSWESVLQDVFTKEAVFSKLLKSYRNTIEISTFARRLMRHLGNEQFDVEPLIRHGEPPTCHEYQSENDRVQKACQLLDAFDPSSLNAIILYDGEAAKKLAGHPLIAGRATLLDTTQSQFDQGNYITSLKNSKGLEFDGVLLYDFDRYIEIGSPISHKQLYVGITRALHRLHLFTNDQEVIRLSQLPL